MKKKNNKGFMLTEALVVSVLITTVLTALYVHFKKVSTSVSESFKYDSISSMYNLSSIRSYIEQENYTAMAAALDLFEYVDLTDCSEYYFSNTDYCKSIFDSVGIKQLILTKENLYGLLNNKNIMQDYIEGPFERYIAKIKYGKTTGYRLIASFRDDTFANVKIFEGDDFVMNIANTCSAVNNKHYTISFIDNDLKSSLQDDYIGEAGCGTIITANDFVDKMENSCYTVVDIPVNQIVISSDESLNKLSISYARINVNVTVNYLDAGNSNAPILPASTLQVGCGTEINSSEKVVQKEGYVFQYANIETMKAGTSDITINLYYRQGSA